MCPRKIDWEKDEFRCLVCGKICRVVRFDGRFAAEGGTGYMPGHGEPVSGCCEGMVEGIDRDFNGIMEET